MAQPKQAVSSDEQAIRDLYVAWRTATMAEDIPTLLKLIADDAVFYVPGQPPMRGKQDFVTMFEISRGKFQFEARSEFEEISIHGDWAYAASRLAVIMTPKAGGPPEKRAGHTLTILRKQGGRWVVARDANMLAADS